MDVFEAAYRVAHDFEGGATGLAQKLGRNAGTFLNKVNPAMDSHLLGLGETIEMQVVAKDYRILYAYAATLSHICIPAGDYTGDSDLGLLEAFAAMVAEQGDFARKLNVFMSGRSITQREFCELRREMFECFQAGLELLKRAEMLAGK